jgi:hypothetical protein
LPVPASAATIRICSANAHVVAGSSQPVTL